jgi:hypothetical protein
LNELGVPLLTDVAAQINFKIKLKYAQEGARAITHEGLGTPFNFKIKLEYAATSVELSCMGSNQFGSKIELRGYLSRRCRRGVIMGVTPYANPAQAGASIDLVTAQT